MKLERLHEYIIPTIATLCGMILAIKLGSLTGKGSVGLMSLILIGAVCVALCIWLGPKTWILLPLTWELTGWVPVTNLPLSVRDMVVGLVVGSYAVFYALKIARLRPDVNWVDFLIWIMMLYLVTVYIRNPVGLNSFGSLKVGGRPYADVVVALLAYLILKRAPVDHSSIRKFPLILMAGSAVTLLGSLLTYIYPASAALLGEVYSGFAPIDEQMMAADVTGRKQGLSMGSIMALRALCSYFLPITLVNPLYFGRFFATLLALAGVLLSGFRSLLVLSVLYGVVASYFRRRIHDIVILGTVGFVGVGFLALGNGRLFTLPLSVQRALTIFPGNWDAVATADADFSTQWRIDMWKIVLGEDRYIHDRLLGDGFGFTRSELAIMQSEILGGAGFIGAARQEGFMITGMVHSGPLSAIRYVGYIGLFIYTCLIFLVGAHAWRLIRKTEGTDFFAPALFVGMPVIIFPVLFCFLAGQFQYDLPATIFSAGLLKLLERGIKSRESVPAGDSRLMARSQGELSSLRPTRPAPVYR